MKTVYSIVAPSAADLGELLGDLDDIALPNSGNWPAEETHLSMPARD